MSSVDQRLRALKEAAYKTCANRDSVERGRFLEDVVLFMHSDRETECISRQALDVLIFRSNIFSWPDRNDKVIRLPYSGTFISGTSILENSEPGFHTNVFQVLKPSRRSVGLVRAPSKVSQVLNVSTITRYRYGRLPASFCYSERGTFGLGNLENSRIRRPLKIPLATISE